MAIKFSDITGGGIPYGNNSARPASPGIGKLYSNGEEKRLELYTSTGWQNIVSETPGVVSISGNYLESVGSGTITITGTNFTTGAIASVIGTNGVEVNATSTTVNSIVSVVAVFTGLSNANEPYDLKVTNTSNLFGLLPDALYINASPVWQTASGSLGTFNEQVSITLSALSATDSDSTISYALASGSTLPSGVTLNSSTGVISGTLPDIASNTTYTFTINASDGANAIVPRTFSLVSNAFATGGTITTSGSYRIHSFTVDGTFTVPHSRQVEYLIVGGGGAGGSYVGGGGGAGGLLTGTLTCVGSYSIVVGNGGTGTTNGAGSSTNGSNGGNSSFNSLIAYGGGAGGRQNLAVASATGGSGGGGSYGLPGASGTSGQGNAGGAGVGAACDSAGGGGGAGGAGDSGTNNINLRGSYGGVGLQSSITGISRWYAAGGQGGEYCAYPGTAFSQNGIGGTSGSQGGGADSVGTAGAVNTGSGGGGGGTVTSPAGGNGGSGIVVIRYAI